MFYLYAGQVQKLGGFIFNRAVSFWIWIAAAKVISQLKIYFKKKYIVFFFIKIRSAILFNCLDTETQFLMVYRYKASIKYCDSAFFIVAIPIWYNFIHIVALNVIMISIIIMALSNFCCLHRQHFTKFHEFIENYH